MLCLEKERQTELEFYIIHFSKISCRKKWNQYEHRILYESYLP